MGDRRRLCLPLRGLLLEGRSHLGSLAPGSVRTHDQTAEVTMSGARIVRRMFAEYLAGKPQAVIARGLVWDSVPNAQGRDWGQSTIGKILKNPVHTGVIVLNGEECPGEHDPIVDRKDFDRVQVMFRARPERRGRPTTNHLFRKACCAVGPAAGRSALATTAGLGTTTATAEAVDRRLLLVPVRSAVRRGCRDLPLLRTGRP